MIKKESKTERWKFKKITNIEQLDTTDMLDLEKDKSVVHKSTQTGEGLKILTPYQMLNRLPISLVQLKAGNNSKKLKKFNKTPIVFSVPFKKTYKTNL